MTRAKLNTVPIDSVRLDPENVREHNERNLVAITKSLEKFGQQKPIVIDNDGVIVAGNGTWMGAKRLHWTEIWVTVTELEGEAKTAFALADNHINELSYFNEDALAATIGAISDTDLLEAAGFDTGELNDIFRGSSEPIELEAAGESAGAGGGNKKPVTVRVAIAVRSVEAFEQALSATGLMNREEALLEVCRTYVEAKGQ
jgi:hypothetical protein